MINVFVARPTTSHLVIPDDELIDTFIELNSDRQDVVFSESSENADIVVFFQKWSFKTKSYAKQLIEDDFIGQNCEKLYVINFDDTVGEGFLPGCYVSLRRSISYQIECFRSIAYPKTYNQLLLSESASEREDKAECLYWFRGNTSSNEVRQKLFQLYSNSDDGVVIDATKRFYQHSDQDKLVYADEMRRAKFVLCPRGQSPNSYRLYEAMSMGKCPVIIADEWVETIGPNWSECSIRIPESKINQLEDDLRLAEPQAKRLGANAKKAWQEHFSEKAKNRAYLDQILDLHSQDPKVTRTFQAYKKHWNSRHFLKNNGWCFSQRLVRHFRRVLNLLRSKVINP